MNQHLLLRFGQRLSALRGGQDSVTAMVVRFTSSAAKSISEAPKDIKGWETPRIGDNPNELKQKALKVTAIGAVVNFVLMGTKGAAGLAVGSTALLADCLNSFGDLFSDAVVYFTVNEARKKATPDQPWGRGKVEPLGAFFVGGLLMCTGAGIGLAAIDSMWTILAANASAVTGITGIGADVMSDAADAVVQHGLSKGADGSGSSESMTDKVVALMRMLGIDFGTSTFQWGGTMGLLTLGLSPGETAALGVSALSVVSKEVLFRFTIRAGRNANSSAVIANAWQHRTDCLVSGAVFVGLSGSCLGYPILDPAVALVISGIVMKQAGEVGIKALRDLADKPAGSEETEALRSTCMGVPGVESVVSIRARQSGPFLFVECTIGVKGDISASSGHRLAELVRLRLLSAHRGRVANALVNVDPLGFTGLASAHGLEATAETRSHVYIADQVSALLLSSSHILTGTNQSTNANANRAKQSLNNSGNNKHTKHSKQSQKHGKKVTARAKSKQANTSDSKSNTGVGAGTGSMTPGSSSTRVRVFGEHEDFGADEVAVRAALARIQEVTEVQVYYKDDGRVAVKVDVSMDPVLTIAQAHAIAVIARKHIERNMTGLASVDVDLELQEF